MSSFSGEVAADLRLKFLEYLFDYDTEGYLCLGTSSRQQGVKTRFDQHFFDWPSDREKIVSFVETAAKTHDVYFCTSILTQQKRAKEFCLPGYFAWADLDLVNPESFDRMIPYPSCVISTSEDRYQAFWRFDELLPADVCEDFSRKLTYATGADKGGWGLTKFMRLPHTVNYKYTSKPIIDVIEVHDARISVSIFEDLPEPTAEFDDDPSKDEQLTTADMPDPDDLPSTDNIFYAYKPTLIRNGELEAFVNLLTIDPEPGADWSARLWRLESICVEADMNLEEVFAIGLASRCNKYARDRRPPSYLWREVKKVYFQHKSVAIIVDREVVELTMPQLVDPDTVEEDSFVTQYKEWGLSATDAPEQYHELACFTALSSLISSGVALHTSFGPLAPNIWGLVLGESTLTRKTTAMRMAMDIVADLDPEVILASDGSAEGLMQALSERPRRVSVFYRDEVTGFFDALNKKDYLANLPEMLTQLYDVPKVLARVLRKERIVINEPYFVFFGGGIRDKVYSLISEDYVLSGFLPRFLVVSSSNDMGRIRRTGPPTENITTLKQRVINTMGELKVMYNLLAPAEIIAGQTVAFPVKITAKMPQEAWDYYGDLEMQLINAANDSPVSFVALPTFQRLAFSLLKMAMLIAATRRPYSDDYVLTVEKADLTQAAWYIQKWGKYTIELISQAGRPVLERMLDRVLRQVRNNPGVLKSAIMISMHLTARDMKEIQATLEERGVVSTKRVGNGTRFYPVGV